MNRISIILPPPRLDRVNPLLVIAIYATSGSLAFAIIAILFNLV